MANRYDMIAAGREAVALDVQYIYGAKPTASGFRTYSRTEIDNLRSEYGSTCVPWPDSNKAGSLCCDCSGLVARGCGVKRGSTGYKETADEVVPVSRIWDDWEHYVGWGLWLPGHIGIVSDRYGYYYALDGSRRNSVHYPMSRQGWVYAIKLCDVDYDEEPKEQEDEVTPEEITAAVAAGINMQEYVQRCGSAAPLARVSNDGGEVYRLYDKRSGDHIFTTKKEADALAKSGWTLEGTAWTATAGGTVPLYRLYNPNGGDHMLTAGFDEANMLYKAGWQYEGISFFAKAEGTEVHRLFNPNGGDHMLTADPSEKDALVDAGWTYEGVAFHV